MGSPVVATRLLYRRLTRARCPHQAIRGAWDCTEACTPSRALVARVGRVSADDRHQVSFEPRLRDAVMSVGSVQL
jgi:hypothetical protein